MSHDDSKTSGKPAASSEDAFLARSARHFVSSAVWSALNFLVGLLFAGLTIRFLGPDRAGFFMALAALTGVLAILSELGLTAPITQQIAECNARGDRAGALRVVETASLLSLLGSALLSVPVIVLLPRVLVWFQLDQSHWSDARSAVLLALATFVANQATNPWRAVYPALERFSLFGALTTGTSLVSRVTGICVLAFAPTMTALAALRFALCLVRIAVDAVLMRRLLGVVPRLSWSLGQTRSFIGFGKWVYFSALGTLGISRLNSLVLTTVVGSGNLPFYEFPQKVFSQVHGAINSQSKFLFPMFAAEGRHVAATVERFGDRLRWGVALASACLYCPIALVGPTAVQGLIGAEFAEKIEVTLALACLQGFCETQTLVAYFASWGMGLGKPNAVKEICQAALVLVTTYLLARRLGYVGASLAQLWVLPVAIWHTVSVGRQVAPLRPRLEWVAAWVSPLALAGICASVVGATAPHAGLVAVTFWAIVGLGLGFAAVHAIETRLFPARGRWPALVDFCREAAATLRRLFSGRVLQG